LEPAAKEVGIVGHFGWHTFRHTYATLLNGNGEDVKVVQELMRHTTISVTLNIYAQAITQSKRDAQSRVVSLLLDKNEEKTSTEAYRTVTDLQNSGGNLQVVDKVGVPSGHLLNSEALNLHGLLERIGVSEESEAQHASELDPSRSEPPNLKA